MYTIAYIVVSNGTSPVTLRSISDILVLINESASWVVWLNRVNFDANNYGDGLINKFSQI